jgi:hypothetical protein
MRIALLLAQIRPTDRSPSAAFIHHHDRSLDQPACLKYALQAPRRDVVQSARRRGRYDFHSLLRPPGRRLRLGYACKHHECANEGE